MSRNAFHEYPPGTVISHGEKTYVVEGTISQGKLGAVFACRDDEGATRALQIVWPLSRSFESIRERWSQQIEELQQVRHPGLLALLDGFEHGGCFHLVHERLDDRLDRWIESPGWDGHRSLPAVAGPLLDALEHIHQSGYTHKDLHPRNVFCTKDRAGGAVKLGDLAVNTLLGNVEVLNTKISRWLVPPEYLTPSECGPIDHRTDIYQAGLLLLCVLQGRITLYSFEEISTGLPAKHAARTESRYGRALEQALQLHVADRFQSAQKLREALNMN
jgi:serine/threonine protein kinase